MPRKRTNTQAETDAPEQIAEREPGDDTKHEEPKFPNPRSWASNNDAGITMLEHRDPYERWLKFRDGKPPQEVIDFVKENGFSWNRDEQVWAKHIGFKTQAQDRLVADRTYAGAVTMMLKAKGIERPEQGQTEGLPF